MLPQSTEYTSPLEYTTDDALQFAEAEEVVETAQKRLQLGASSPPCRLMQCSSHNNRKICRSRFNNLLKLWRGYQLESMVTRTLLQVTRIEDGSPAGIEDGPWFLGGAEKQNTFVRTVPRISLLNKAILIRNQEGLPVSQPILRSQWMARLSSDQLGCRLCSRICARRCLAGYSARTLTTTTSELPCGGS